MKLYIAFLWNILRPHVMGQSSEAFMDESNISKSAIEDNTSLEEDSWSDLDMPKSEEVHWKQPVTKPSGVVPKPFKTQSIIRTGKTDEGNYLGPTVSFNDAIWTKKEILRKKKKEVLRTGPLNLNKSWDKTSRSQTPIAPVKRGFTIKASLNTTPSITEKRSKVGPGLPRPYRRLPHRHGHALGHRHRHRHRHRHAHQGHRKKEIKSTKSYWFLKNIPRIKPQKIRNHKRYSIMSHKNIIIANKTARNTKELEAIIRRNKNVLESERREEIKRKKKSEVKMLNLRDLKVRGVVKELLQRILSRKRERKRNELSIENESYELKRNLNKALLGHNMSTKFKKDPISLNFNNRKIRKIDLSDFTESSHENLERVFKRKLRLGLQKIN